MPVSTYAQENMLAWAYPLAPEILANDAGYLTMINKENLLEEDFVPQDLVDLSIQRVSAVADGKLRKKAHDALKEMFDVALNEGHKLYVKSAYRSYQTQKTMHTNRVKRYGYDDGVVAYPGSSDHQTGLGVDVLNYKWTQEDGMRPEFGEDKEAQWMAAHCHEFGFIIRYMEDKQEITGIIYEPWHLRYVGIEAATYIMENHLSMEEFDAQWKQYIIDYEAQGGDFEALLTLRAQPNPVIVLGVSDDGEEEVSMFYD